MLILTILMTTKMTDTRKNFMKKLLKKDLVDIVEVVSEMAPIMTDCLDKENRLVDGSIYPENQKILEECCDKIMKIYFKKVAEKYFPQLLE